MVLVTSITGCVVAAPKSNKTWVSNDPSLTSVHWFKANEECQYDANKYSTVTQTIDNNGTIGANSYTDNSRLVDLYYQCMYSKGGWHLEDLETFNNSKKSNIAELDLAVELSNKGKYSESILKLNDYIDKDPENCFGYGLRGVAYHGKKQFDMAILNYNDAIRLCDKEASFYMYRSVSYAMVNQYKDAINDANKSIYLKPKMCDYYRSRSDIYYLNKEYNKAIEDLTQAISLSDNNNADRYYLTRGKIYLKIGTS